MRPTPSSTSLLLRFPSGAPPSSFPPVPYNTTCRYSGTKHVQTPRKTLSATSTLMEQMCVSRCEGGGVELFPAGGKKQNKYNIIGNFAWKIEHYSLTIRSVRPGCNTLTRPPCGSKGSKAKLSWRIFQLVTASRHRRKKNVFSGVYPSPLLAESRKGATGQVS